MPDQLSAFVRLANGVHVTKVRALQKVVLFHGHIKSVVGQETDDRTKICLGIDFDDELANLRPVALRQPMQDVQLTLYDVDFQQIDLLDAALRDDTRQRPQLRGNGSTL